MKTAYHQLLLLSMLMNIVVYSVHNFITDMLEDSGTMDFKQILQTQSIYSLKFLSAFCWTNICDKNGKHKHVFIFSTLLYACSAVCISCITYLPERIKFVVLICCLITYSIGNGGMFPIIDSMIFKLLRKSRKTNQIGRFRFFGTIGHLLTNVFLSGLHSLQENKILPEVFLNNNHLCNTFTCLFFAIIVSTITFLLPEFEKPDEILVEKPVKKISKGFFKGVYERLRVFSSPVFYCYCFSVLSAGIDRIGISNFLSKYTTLIGLQRSEVHFLLLLRTIPELFIYGLSEYLAKFIGLDLIFMSAIFITTARTFFYSTADLSGSTKMIKCASLVVTEATKGIYGALFHYSAMQRFNSFANDESVSTAQGIFHSCYNSIPYFPFSLLQFFFSSVKNNKKIGLDDLRTLFKIVAIISLGGFLGPIISLSRKRKFIK